MRGMTLNLEVEMVLLLVVMKMVMKIIPAMPRSSWWQ
jgi:hypothetical protein